MQTKIHPKYNNDVKVTCSSCDNIFTTGSTKDNITVEVCYKCHPFYTGAHRFLDAKGRVESFERKRKIAANYQQIKTSKKPKKHSEEHQPKTLKELLAES